MNMLTHSLKRSLNRVGLDIVRYHDLHHSYIERYSRAVIGSNQWVQVVVDVGAHAGLYAQKLRDSGFRGTLHCFEPQCSRYQEILARSAGDDRWFAHNVGAGDRDAVRAFYVDEVDDTSSSFLSKASKAWSTRDGVRQTSVRVVSLDDYLLPLLQDDAAVWIKIDAEGFEGRVLEGACKLLQRTRFVEIELSFVERYQGCPLAHEIIAQLRGAEFILYSIDNAFRMRNHRLSYCDAIFVRKDFEPPEI